MDATCLHSFGVCEDCLSLGMGDGESSHCAISFPIHRFLSVLYTISTDNDIDVLYPEPDYIDCSFLPSMHITVNKVDTLLTPRHWIKDPCHWPHLEISFLQGQVTPRKAMVGKLINLAVGAWYLSIGT